jgi:PAS domain S-box-containing protein
MKPLQNSITPKLEEIQKDGKLESHKSRLGQIWVFVIGSFFCLVVSVIAWYTLGRVETITRADLSSSLKTILRTTNSALQIWEFERKADAVTGAESVELRANIKELLKVPRTRDALMSTPVRTKLNTLLAPRIGVYGYLGYLVIAPDLSNIGSSQDTNLGVTNLLAEQGNFLERVFEGETLISHPLISDVPLLNIYSGRIVEGEPTMFVVTPVFDDEGGIVAALGFRLDPAIDFTRILQLGRTGQTGETYAFNSKGTLLSESRFDRELRMAGLTKNRGLLSIEIRNPGQTLSEGLQPQPPTNEQPFTTMANTAISRRSGVNIDGYRNYLGVEVVSAWTWDPGMQLALATEVSVDEAYRSFNFVRKLILSAMGLTGVLAIGITFMVNIGRTRALSLVSAVDVGRDRALQFAKMAQERETRMRGVVDNVGDAIITFDGQGTIESFSPVAEKIFGYFSPEVVGQNISILVPEPDRSAYSNYLRNYLEAGKAIMIGVEREVEGMKKDGTVFPLDITINEMCFEDNRIFIGTLRDISERKQAEDKLKRSHEELQVTHQELKASLTEVQKAHNSLVASEKLAGIGGLTSGICREALGILGTISVQLQKLNGMQHKDSSWTQAVRVSHEETARLEKIIHSLLNFFKKGKEEVVSVRINEELDSVLTMMDHHLKSKGIEINKQFDSTLPTLRVDPEEMSQVFFYIIDNARQAMPEGGTLATSIKYKKKNGTDYIRINITDNGDGIRKEDLKQIFNPFFSNKPTGQGTGMGLSVCSHLIKKNGGDISVESERGKGTTFSIDLPCLKT